MQRLSQREYGPAGEDIMHVFAGNPVFEREEMKVCVCFIPRKQGSSPLSSSLLPQRSSHFSQSVFGEIIVGFRERVALFGQEQARIGPFPFIILLLQSPPNILLCHLFSFCPFLHYSSFPTFFFAFLLPHSRLAPTHPSHLLLTPPQTSPPSVSPSPDWGSVLLVRQPMCLSVCVRER